MQLGFEVYPVDACAEHGRDRPSLPRHNASGAPMAEPRWRAKNSPVRCVHRRDTGQRPMHQFVPMVLAGYGRDCLGDWDQRDNVATTAAGPACKQGVQQATTSCLSEAAAPQPTGPILDAWTGPDSRPWPIHDIGLRGDLRSESPTPEGNRQMMEHTPETLSEARNRVAERKATVDEELAELRRLAGDTLDAVLIGAKVQRQRLPPV